jgi:hypothetical protein
MSVLLRMIQTELKFHCMMIMFLMEDLYYDICGRHMSPHTYENVMFENILRSISLLRPFS